MPRRGLIAGALAVSAVLGCGSDQVATDPTGGKLWVSHTGSSCPYCFAPVETQRNHMQNALTYYVKWWEWPCSEVIGILDGFLIYDQVGPFDTSGDEAGKWVPPSIRQQWAIATTTWLWITPEEVWDYGVLAVTLMHEGFHEYYYRIGQNTYDEDMVETSARSCLVP